MSASSPPLWRRSRWLRWITYAVGALALLTLASWLAVPPIVRAQLESRLTASLGRQTTVEAVAFNPFKLQLTLSRLAIAGRTGPRALLAVDEIVANLSSASIWHRAPVLDALRITRPSVSLARDREGRYSIQDLIDAPSTGPPGPPSFSLNNIEVVDGSIAFDDGVTGRKHELTALDIGIPFLSTLAYQTDVRVTPRMSGTLNGTRFTLGGSTTPFAEPREAALDIELDALPLASYVAYLPARPSFEVAGGALTTHLKLAFVDGKPGERRLELRGDAQVDALELKRRRRLAAGGSGAHRRRDRAHRPVRQRRADRVDRARRAAGGRPPPRRRGARMGAAAGRRAGGRRQAGIRGHAPVERVDRQVLDRARRRHARRPDLGLRVEARRRHARRIGSRHPAGRAGARQARVRLRRPDRGVLGRGRRAADGAVRHRPLRAFEILARPAVSLLQEGARGRRAEGLARLRLRVHARRRRRPAVDRGRGVDRRPAPHAAGQPRAAVARAATRAVGRRCRRVRPRGDGERSPGPRPGTAARARARRHAWRWRGCCAANRHRVRRRLPSRRRRRLRPRQRLRRRPGRPPRRRRPRLPKKRGRC